MLLSSKFVVVVYALLLVHLTYVSGRSTLREARSEEQSWSEMVRKDIKKSFFDFFRYFDEPDPVEVISSIFTRDKTGIANLMLCSGCKEAISFVKNEIDAGVPIDDIANPLVELCVLSNIYSRTLCEGVRRTFKDLAYYMFQKLEAETDEVCSIVLYNACGDVHSEFHNFTVEIPGNKPQVVEPVPVPNRPRLKVLQLSDTHFDPDYITGASTICKESICCRSTSGNATAPDEGAGYWGNYKSCDIPERTLVSALDHIKNTHPDLDYVIWTGDLPPHNTWEQSREFNLEVINETISKVFGAFPDIPVLVALGNHEAHPPSVFSPHEEGNTWSMSWLYDVLDEQWGQKLPNTTSSTIKYGAYYSHYVRPGLKLLSLNMNYCYNMNFWLALNSTDQNQELKWMVNELLDSENKGDKVHIIGHIPPGNRDCIKKWSENYNNIVYRFENTIAGQFFGHTHQDSFQVFYDTVNYTRPISVGYVSPSLTTYTDLNPGYRIYYIDGDHNETTRMALEHETWIMDLPTSNYNGTAHWTKLYDTKSEYGIQFATPRAWNDFIERMIDDEELFNRYYKNTHKAAPVWEDCVTVECKHDYICETRSARSHFEDVLCSDVSTKLETFDLRRDRFDRSVSRDEEF